MTEAASIAFRNMRGEVGQNWVGVQQKTFLKWLNHQLGDVVDDINLEQLDNGVFLIQCVEKLTEKKIGRYQKNPRGRFQKLENINLLLKFLKAEGFNLVNIGASDIESCNPKIILGLLWKIISRYQIGATKPTDPAGQLRKADPQKDLMTWVDNTVTGYGIAPVQNFKSSFKDGRRLAALVDSLEPGSMDMKNLGDPLEATRKAMDIAHKKHGVPKLMEAEDLITNPEPHSVMTYLSEIRNAKEKPRLPGRLPAPRPEEKIVVATGKSSSLAPMEQVLKRGKSPENSVDLLNYMRTPQFNFPNVKALIRAFNQAAKEEEKIKGQMLKWLNRNRDRAVKEKAYVRNTPRPEVAILYEQGRAGPRTMQHLRNLLAQGKTAPTLEDLAELIRQEEEKGNKLSEKEKEYLRKMLMDKNAGLWDEDDPYALQLKKMQPKELDKLYNVAQSVTGAMTYIRQIAQETKDKKRPPMRSPPDLPRAVKELADKDKKVIAGFLKSPEAKLLAPLAKKQLTAADVDTLFREGGAGARTIAHLHALNKAGKSFEELDDLIPALKQMENQALAKDAKDPAAAASAILGDVQLQALRRGKDDYATGAGTGGDAPVDAPRIVMTWHAGPKTEKERQDEAAKEALNDFLNDPLCPLFTPEGNQKKRITPKDMDALFEIEKSGPGTGALLNALQEQGTKVDSFPELLAAAKDLDDRNRDALQDYLNDPETKLFNDPSHADVDRNDVARLMEESGAGPATLPLLQQLEGKGQKFRNVDDMIPAVKKLADERRALPKSALSDEEVLGGLGAGGASAAVAEALNDADQLPTDIEKLRDYLNHPDTGLLDDAKSHDYPDAQLQALADAAKGVDNAIDLLEYLNNEGQHYTSVPELKDALPSAVPKRDAVKKRVKDLLNDKPKGLLAPGLPAPTDRDVDDLYNEAKAGPKTAAALRAIADDDGPKRFNSVPELTDAVKAKARKRKKRDNDRKQAIEDYLKTPDCPAFSPAGNKDKKVDPKKVNDLFRIEQSGPGTVALLNALEAEGTKPSSVPELIAAAKTLSDKKRKGLQEHLADAKTPALKDAKGRDAKADSTPPIAALVTEESEGGPATTVGAKMVDAEGKKVNKSEDLIPLIKKALKKKRNVPQSSLTPEERAAGLGLGSASKGVGDALAEQTPEDDRNALYDYLTSPDVGLLASADIDPKDLDAILAQADGAKDAIDKLEYLDHEGKRYPGVQDLADHVPESDPKRDDVKEQLAKILKDPKKKVVASGPGAGGSPVSPSDLDKLYEKAEAGPRTAAHLREAAAEAKTPAKNLDELAKNLNDAEKKAKDRKRKAKAALKDYLDSPDCPLFTPFGKQTKPAATKENVNDLFSPEKSGPGTAALLDALAAQGQQFDSIPELLDAAKALSAQKRKELKDHLADPACPVYNNAKDKVKPDSASAARLAEESEAGPLTLPIVKELEAARTKVNDSDDLIPLVKKHVSKKPKGPAARALEAGIKEQNDEDAKEREALKDYLTSPDTYLLPDSEEKKLNDEALAALIAAEDGSFPDTLRALDELNEDGREFKSIPELLEAVKDHKLQTAGVKADMKELLDDPRREIYAPASSTDPLTNDDVGAMYDRGDVGLDSASVLNNLDQTKPYNNKDDLIDAYKDAARKQKQKKKHDKEALKDYLSDPDCPIFTPEENKKKHITPHDVNQVYAVEKSGPGTGAMLKAFQDEGKHFNSIPELLAAAKDYHDKREKKAKEGVDPDADRPLSSVHDIPEGTFEASVDPTKRGKALADDNKGDGRDEEELMTYLGDPTTKLLSGKPRDYHDGRDVEDARDLLAAAGGIEEALPLLEQLEADGKHYDSIPDMMRDLPYAKAKQAKKHKEVRDYLNDPRTNLVPASAKPGTDSKADAAVDDLVDHGGAGPDTLPILKELAGEGKTYPTLDALGEAIKQKRRGKKKNNNDDIQKLKDYLSGPDCELLQDAKDPSLKNDELADLLDEGDGLDNTLDLLNYLNDDGKHYDSVPDITKHLKDALPKRRKVKDRMQNLINDPAKELLPADAAPTNVGGHPGTKNEPITDKDVEDLYHAAKAGPDTAAALRELADDGKHFNSLPELEQALKDNARKQKKKKKEDKAALKNYLEDPSCPALTPAGNKDKKVTPHDVNNLFKNEKSGPGTVALLNALEDAGKKGSSIPDLLAAAKDLSKKKRKELQDHLNDAKCPAFNSGPDVNRDASPEAAEILAKETGAGPATLADLKGVEAGGKGPKVNNTEDLIPFIKDQHKKRKDLPKSALNSDEKKGGDGVGAATKAFEAAAAKRDPEADRNALLDYLQNRDNGLLDDPSTLAPKDMDAVLSEADGAKDAIDLCEYHDHDGDRYPTIENLGEHLREAEPLRDDVKNQLKDLLNDPKNHLLPTESGPVTAADVDKIYNDAEAGPRTAAHLRELAAKGKEFKTPDDLVNALKDAERAAKRKKRKDKAALREYLNSPDCAAFTPAGNQRKPDVSPADVNDLYKNEKSGPGTAALLDALEGKKYDSVPDLIKAAADLSDKKRKELKNHLQDPRAPVFSEAKDKDKAKPTSKEVDRLAEESEAGPASLPVVKELEGKGTKVQKSDDLIPLVKEAFRKKPKGAASKALEAGPSDVDNFVAPGDAEKLMDYLASPDVGLLDGMQGDMQDDDLKDALLEGGGLTETLAACKDLDDDGRSFDNIPDLVEAIKDRRLKEEGVKQELKDLLEDPDNKLYNGEPLTMNQVDNLYDKAGGDLDAAAHLRELAAEGKFTSKNLDDIADALKDAHRKAAKDKKKDKEKLREYLSKPDCPLFTPAGNKNKDVTPQDVNKFYGIEETGPGTGALLNALEESGKKFDSLPDLLAAAKDLSDKRQNALADHLADPTSAVQRDDDHPISASDADKLAKESTAGPATLELMKQLEAQGKKFDSVDDLIPEIKKLHDKKRKVPKSSLTPQERVAGVGPSPLDGPVSGSDRKGGDGAGSGPVTDADVEAMLDYLRSPDNDLLDGADNVEVADVRDLLEDAGGLEPALALCDYLQDDGKTFNSVPELTKSLPLARSRQAKEKKDIKDMLNEPRNQRLLGDTPKPLNDNLASKIHDDGHAGPKTTAHIRELAADGKAFGTPDQLADAIKDLDRKEKRKKRKQKQALQNYLDDKNCDLLTPAGNQNKDPVSRQELNDLWRNEKSGPGTAALLNELKASGQKFDSIPDLLDAAKATSGKKRKELKDKLGDPRLPLYKDVKDKNKVKPTAESVARLAEESEAGPKTAAILKELADMGKTFDSSDDMIPFVKKFAKNGLGPLGAAMNKSEDNWDDIDKLKDYLSSPDCNLLDDAKEEIKDKDLSDMLDEGVGLDNTIDLCEYLNKDGLKYPSVPALTAGLDHARPKRRKVKDRMKDVLNEPLGLAPGGTPVNTKAAEDLYADVQAGPQSAAAARALADKGEEFPTTEALTDGLKLAARAAKKQKQKDKADIKAYLERPDCPAFSPSGNKAKGPITTGFVNDLYRLEQSGPGTIALLNALEENNKQAVSVPELYKLAKEFADKEKKKCSDHVGDAKAPIFNQPAKGAEARHDGARDGPDTTAIVAEESEAGPATLVHIKELEKAGESFPSREPLIQAVKKRHYDRKDLPKTQLTKEERLVGLGVGSASGVLKPPKEITPFECEELMEYLADPETELLDDDQSLKMADLEALLLEADGDVKEAIDLCEHLNHAGKRYNDVPDLTDHLKDALPMRKKVKQEMAKVLQDPSKTPLNGAPKVSDADIDKVYKEGQAGPRSAAIVRDFGWDAKDDKSKGIDGVPKLGEQLQEEAASRKRKKKVAKLALRDYLNSPGCPAWTPAKKEEVTTGDINALYRLENSAPGTIALLNSLEAQKKKFDNFPALLGAAKSTSNAKRRDVADFLSSPKAEAVIPAAISPALTATSGEVVRLAEESYAGPVTPLHLAVLAKDRKQVPDSDELIPLIRKLHNAKKDSPFAGLSIEEGLAGLGDGSAGRMVNQKMKEKEKTLEEDVEALMEYLASEECYMMNEVKELEPDDLRHLLNVGYSLAETLNLCKWLNHQCCRYDSVPELTEAIREARTQAFAARREGKEMISSSMNHILPGWGEHLQQSEISAIFDAAECGLGIVPYLRELLEGRREYKSQQELSDALYELHNSAVVKRRNDLKNIRDWMHGLHGETCALFPPAAKTKLHFEIKEAREFFRIELSSYGTAALLKQLQVAKKSFADYPALLAGGRAFSDEKRAIMLKQFSDKKNDIFAPMPGKTINVTAASIKELCEESTCGPNTLVYVNGLASGRKKYLNWEDIYSVVKRLNAFQKDPYWILKEGDPPKKPKPQEVVEVEHWNVDALAEYLRNPESKLLKNKKDINDKLLVWLLREGKGIGPTLRHLKLLDKDGAQFDSIRSLTIGVRRAIKTEEDIKAFLTKADCKLLSAVDSKTPTKDMKIEHAEKLYETVCGGIYSVNILEQMARETKSAFPSMDALIKAAHDTKEAHHDAVMDILGEADCVLLNSVDNITTYNVNEILQSSGAKGVAQETLKSLNDSSRTFFNVPDLCMAVRKITGIAEVV